jgi:hypothetical protein
MKGKPSEMIKNKSKNKKEKKGRENATRECYW